MPDHRLEATVTVLMPTFNRAGFIGEAISSVLAQTHAPYEVIVLDDGSTDNVAAVCSQFGNAIRYIPLGENMGKSAAINKGLEHARGEYIWVMDDDDIATPDALQTLLAPMRASPRIGFTFGQLSKFTDASDGRRVFEPAGEPAEHDPRSLFVRLMEDCFITGQPCALFRRECFDAIGPIDTSVVASVDYNILLQIARRFAGADVGKVVLWQRQHPGLRGPACLRYDSEDRIKRWMAFDARLLNDLLPRLALEEFLGERPSGRRLSAVKRRRALFQKAVVAGRKNLWRIAIVSLRQARAASDEPLNDADRLILSQMLGSRYGIDHFLGDVRVQNRLAVAAGCGVGDEVGAEIRAAIAARLTFWIGHALPLADYARILQMASALLRVAGPDRSVRLASRALAKRLGGGGGDRPAYAQQGVHASAFPAHHGAQDAAEATR